jgi:hypothetical protein
MHLVGVRSAVSCGSLHQVPQDHVCTRCWSSARDKMYVIEPYKRASEKLLADLWIDLCQTKAVS